MTTPRYVARKVGDQYVLVREDLHRLNPNDWITLAGGAVVLHGALKMVRQSIGSLAIMIGGGMLMYRGITGCWGWRAARPGQSRGEIQAKRHRIITMNRGGHRSFRPTRWMRHQWNHFPPATRRRSGDTRQRGERVFWQSLPGAARAPALRAEPRDAPAWGGVAV